MSTYPEEFSRLESENKALKQENERLRVAICNIPTDIYGEAQRDGCDCHGAWHCFLGELGKWEKQALSPNEPKFCVCCEEITEENAYLHRNCGK